MKKLLSTLATILFIFIVSCNQRPEAGDSVRESTLTDVSTSAEQQTPGQIDIPERKVIREGEVEFRTPQLAKTANRVTKIVREAKGYISNEHTNQYPDRIEQQITMRIPADNFDRVLEKLAKEAGSFDRKNIMARDVSEEYIDVKARLETKKKLSARYSQLLTKATKIQEILEIEKEMGTLQSDIESIEGRLNYLDDRIGMSTLTVIFYEEKSGASTFSSRMGSAVNNGWNVFLSFLIGLMNLWVFVVISILLFFVIANRRKSRQSKAKP